MNSKHCFYSVISLLIFIINIIIYRNKRCLPVIAVYNIRCKINIPYHFKHGSVEKYETFTVIVESIKTVSHVIIFIINKIICNIILYCGKNTAVLLSP